MMKNVRQGLETRGFRVLTALALLFCCLSMVIVRPALAQNSSEEILAAEDVLTITVLNHPEFSGDVIVATDGKIQIPLIGSLVASGKSLNQLNVALRKALLKELRDPQFSLALKQAHARRVFVLGAVNKPGIVEIKAGWRVTEVLAAAGGLAARAELSEATLNRAKQQPIVLDLLRLMANGNDAANLPVRAEDVLRVSSRTVQVSVAGQVLRPGTYDVAIGNGVIEALAIAGGATPRAATTQITIKHLDGSTLPIDLIKAMQPGQVGLNIPLQNGDVVVVPEARAQVTVRGAVEKPGFVAIPDGQTLQVTDAIALAGGQTLQAALSQATVTRADGTNISVDLYKALILGQRENNLALQDGDLIVVPESRAHVTVRSEVLKPGEINLPDGQNLYLSEAIALAGGETNKAALSKTTIEHKNGTTEIVDLYQIRISGDKKNNIMLAPGDIVTVPAAAGITVLGAVQKSGTFYFPSGSAPLSEALALAGGLSIQPGQARIGITRTIGGKTQVLNPDPLRLINDRDATQNTLLQDGDFVTVSATQSQTVFISGQVERPGAYEMKEGDSVPELIARAGGVTSDASLSRIAVTQRSGTSETLNALEAVRDGKKMNYELRDGAVVVVPENKSKILVLGAVTKQGSYTIPENEQLTLGEVLGLAGGARERAKVWEIGLFKKDANDPGKVSPPKIVSINQVKDGQLALNQPLEEGTIVYVPEGKLTQSAWSKLTSGISSLALFGRLF